MNELKNNKKTIIICLVLIIIVFVIYKITLKKETIEGIDIINDEYLRNYGINEIIPVYMTEENVVKKYFNDYKNDMISNKEDAWYKLNKEYREIKFGSYENFLKYLDETIMISTYNMEVDKYSVTGDDGSKLFNIIDRSGKNYIIKEKSINNYEVYLDDYTVKI